MKGCLDAKPAGRAFGAVGLFVAVLSSAGCGRTVDQLGAGGSGGGSTASATLTTSASKTSSGMTTGTSMASGTSSGTSSSSGGPVCSGFGDACTECQSASCSDVWCGCRNEPECIAILQCWSGCTQGDQACVQACIGAHQAGVSAALLVSDCAGTTCNPSCKFGKAETPCTICLLDNCPAAMNACFVDAECLPLYQCLAACPPASLTCQQACYNAHGAGVSTLQSVVDCSTVQCPQVCN